MCPNILSQAPHPRPFSNVEAATTNGGNLARLAEASQWSCYKLNSEDATGLCLCLLTACAIVNNGGSHCVSAQRLNANEREKSLVSKVSPLAPYNHP